MTTGYEPLNTLKPVVFGVWLIDGPAIRFYGVPFSTRATVIRLRSGNIWVHSPTRLTESLRAEVAELGPVRHLVAPNWIHYAYLTEWQAAFPGVTTWAAPGVARRAQAKGMELHIDHRLGQDAPDDWAGEIDQMIVEGSSTHREAVFFHHATRTLILTDLIENFERENMPLLMWPLLRMVGILDPHGSMPKDMRATFRDGHEQLEAAVRQMIDWGPERVILAHGRWFETGGTEELKRAFGWIL
ncbi:DUF4336 domain-containing protein [Marinibacterium profundimaris]|uniref:DUF4336 domain-containing protein n=1 Tax=Marinibacterium profundimaris TaxID=1679460 RepID=A0A225NHC9_9RHOB|nr:DUF4336 domain-containing protein [Marinibacterium profundimaris]OWU73255.1 hypothetical protein ATO3_11160 [Marinibacterium profundimaris]